MLKLSIATAVAVAALTIAAVSLGGGSNAPSALAAPANDDFANATVIDALPFDDGTDLGRAVRRRDEPLGSCSQGQITKTVWYKLAAAQSGYVSATVTGDADSDTAIASYRGADSTDLALATCSNRWSAPRTAALSVVAGQTYYFQVGTFLEDRVIQPTTPVTPPLHPAVGGVAPPSIPVIVHFETFEVPPCAPSKFTVNDPRSDAIAVFVPPSPPGSPDAPLDITGISAGSDDTNFCLRVHLSAPIPVPTDHLPGSVFTVDFDADGRSSGWSGYLNWGCRGRAMGSDVRIRVEHPASVIVPLEVAFPPRLEDGLYQRWNGYLLTKESSFMFIAPLEALEGDDILGLGVTLLYGTGLECVPNHGIILSPDPAAPGDSNCDGATDSTDSSLILQRSARLLFEDIICEYAGDVDGNNRIEALDAALILQYSAGLISQF